MADDFSRRRFLQTAAAGGAMLAPGLSLLGQDTKLKEQKPKRRRKRRRGLPDPKAKSVILLWMGGGPSQMDTFDPKPGHANGGKFKAIDTTMDGVQVSQHLPTVAKQMGNLGLLRAVYTNEPEHFRASYMMHTGVKFLASFPYPSMGSLISYELSESLETPGFVSIGTKAFGPTFLGYEHAPFVVDNPNSALRMLRDAAKKNDSLDLARALGADFADSRGGVNIKKRDTFYERIDKILDSPFKKALDLNREPKELRDAYGRDRFGQGCLLARRLVEIGVKFIEVHLGGWDTHENNFDRTEKLMGKLDPAMGTLVEDLKRKELLDQTIVLWMGEFGRTPKINGKKGRDHWARNFSVVFGGGGVQPGRWLGKTDPSGMGIAGGGVEVADLFATVYYLLGMDPSKKYYSPQGSLVKATEDGTPIKKLIT